MAGVDDGWTPPQGRGVADEDDVRQAFLTLCADMRSLKEAIVDTIRFAGERGITTVSLPVLQLIVDRLGKRLSKHDSDNLTDDFLREAGLSE